MPEKIHKAFQKEYGKSRGNLIFYKWENKHGLLHHSDSVHPIRHHAHKTSELILKGNNKYINHMYKHLNQEHPSVRKKIFIRR